MLATFRGVWPYLTLSCVLITKNVNENSILIVRNFVLISALLYNYATMRDFIDFDFAANPF